MLISVIEGARQRGRPRKTWKELVAKGVYDLYRKPSDAMDLSKERRMIRGNWSDRSSDIDAKS